MQIWAIHYARALWIWDKRLRGRWPISVEDILVVYDNTPLPDPYTHKLPGKAAPEVFGNISRELESLHCVLGEAAESPLSHPLPPRREAKLKTILDGCVSVLADLQFIVQKYQSLGTDDRSSWDRLRLGGEDIAEIRSRLSLNIMLLTAFRRFVLWPRYR